ncbi:MAG: hypothetical protein AABW85_06210 [archaeon]
MVKVSVQITQKELDYLENKAICWNHCNKHKGVLNATEEELFRFTQECKRCLKINRQISSSCLHLWAKLMTAYQKATKKSRKKYDRKFGYKTS